MIIRLGLLATTCDNSIMNKSIQFVAEDVIQRAFSVYGTIQEIRIFKDKGYAFIRLVYNLMLSVI